MNNSWNPTDQDQNQNQNQNQTEQGAESLSAAESTPAENLTGADQPAQRPTLVNPQTGSTVQQTPPAQQTQGGYYQSPLFAPQGVQPEQQTANQQSANQQPVNQQPLNRQPFGQTYAAQGPSFGQQGSGTYGGYRAPYTAPQYGSTSAGYGAQQAQPGVGTYQAGTQGAPMQGGYYQQPAGAYAPQPRRKAPSYASKTALVWCTVICILLSLLLAVGAFLIGRATAGKTTFLPGKAANVTVEQYSGNPIKYEKGDGSYASVVAEIKEAVVEITTETVSTSSLFGQYITGGAGSGVIIDKTGYIITCNHVVDGANSITVKLTTGETFEAELIGKDAQTDIAVVKISSDKDLPYVAFADSDALAIGEEVIAIGNPLGSLGGSVTNGIVSATGREIEIDGQLYTLLQTNAAINPGNSGGGLFDMNGHLVGIVNAKSTGEDIEGLGFAIPSNMAREISSQLMSNGYIKGRVKLGFSLFEVRSQEDYTQWWQYHQYVTDYGVYIAESTLSQDFHVGDRIVAFNGTEISTISELKAELNKCSVGDTVTITVSRYDPSVQKSTLLPIDITLAEKTADD